MVRMEMRIVVNFECRGCKSGGDLDGGGQLSAEYSLDVTEERPASRKELQDRMCTFCRITSSTGVCDAMVENGLAALARPDAARRNMGQIPNPPTATARLNKGESEGGVSSVTAARNLSPAGNVGQSPTACQWDWSQRPDSL